jgi:hypothetical protein
LASLILVVAVAIKGENSDFSAACKFWFCIAIRTGHRIPIVVRSGV